MELLIKDKEIKDQTYKPHVELVDKEARKYYVYNKLSEKNPSIIFRESDPSKKGTVAFSCFVDNAKLLPPFTVGEDGKSASLWEEIECPGIFKLQKDEKLTLYGQRKDGNTESMDAAQVEVKEGVVLMDIFTMCMLEGTDIMFIINASNALRVERVTLVENDDELEKRQTLRKHMILKLNRIINGK